MRVDVILGIEINKWPRGFSPIAGNSFDTLIFNRQRKKTEPQQWIIDLCDVILFRFRSKDSNEYVMKRLGRMKWLLRDNN